MNLPFGIIGIAMATIFMPETREENVAALESAIPLDLKPGQIRAPMGAGWIPTDLVEKFIRANGKS